MYFATIKKTRLSLKWPAHNVLRKKSTKLLILASTEQLEKGVICGNESQYIYLRPQVPNLIFFDAVDKIRIKVFPVLII